MFCQENLADFWRAPAVFPRDPAKSLSCLAPTAIYNLINRVRLQVALINLSHELG